jgi:Chromosome segregation protein Spc25
LHYMNELSRVWKSHSLHILRFTFTQLDAGDPLRSFSFVLNVNDEDTYEVEETLPPLDASVLAELLAKLNETDDLSVFCRGMRK